MTGQPLLFYCYGSFITTAASQRAIINGSQRSGVKWGAVDGEEWVLIIPTERKRLAAVRNFVAAFARSAGAHPKRVEGLMLAVDELVTNVIVHGYQDRPGDVEVSCTRSAHGIQVTIRDRAPLYDVTGAPSPDVHLPLEQRPVGGLGLHLVRKSVDRFDHRARPGGGNELTVEVGIHPRQALP